MPMRGVGGEGRLSDGLRFWRRYRFRDIFLGMSIGSMFAGIGGLELGLESCGLGPVMWQAEMNPSAVVVLENHWPKARRYGDVREVDETAANVGIICGGFPCQDTSQASHGKAVGMQGERSGLWREMARAIGCLRPEYVFVENPTSGLRHWLGTILGDLAAVGYDAEWDTFTAAECGAPHLRERTFVLGRDPNGYGQPIGAEHGEVDKLRACK